MTRGVDPDASTADAARRPPSPRERCNQRDDDGDGRTDEGCPIRVTRDEQHDAFPAVSGRWITWIRMDAQYRGDRGDLYVRELPDGVERKIAEGARYPSIAGERVVFLSDDDAIALFDLRTGEERTIASDEAAVQRPVIAGDFVAWSQLEPGSEEDYEVFAYDLRTGVRTRVATHPTIQMFPVIDGRAIAWIDDRRGHHTIGLLHLNDVYAAELGGEAPVGRQISAREGNDLQYGTVASIQNGRVLVDEWHGAVDQRDVVSTCEPVLFDVATRERIALDEPRTDCLRPGVLGGPYAALVHDPDGVADVVLVELATGVQRRVTTYERRSIRPRLSEDGTLLVWMDDRNEHWDVYAMDLTDLASGDFFPEGVAP